MDDFATIIGLRATCQSVVMGQCEIRRNSRRLTSGSQQWRSRRGHRKAPHAILVKTKVLASLDLQNPTDVPVPVKCWLIGSSPAAGRGQASQATPSLQLGCKWLPLALPACQ